MKNIIAKFYIIGLVFAVGVPLQSIAADWTDKDDSTVTYTALKSIKGNGSAYIMTDITPECTDTVRTKVKLTSIGNQCIYCARDSNAKYSFSGFLVNQKFRIDRNGTDNQVSAKANANTTDEYSLEADYGSGTFLINGESQSSIGTGTYTVKGPMSLFASHKGGRSFDNKGSYFLYYFQLWDSQCKLKHNFIPAKKEDATGATTIGLYDTVKNKFYSQSAFTYSEYADFDRAGKKWTGAGDGVSMSDDDNWEGGVAPVAGDDLDFTIAVPNAEIVADIVATFGKVYLGTGDIPKFTGALSATAINDLPKMQAYATAEDGFIFTLAAPSGQNFTWNGSAANWWAADAWDYNTAASVWYDNNTAVFNTANATATLNANVTAESVVFGKDATIVTNGTDAATLTVPTVSVAQNVSATIDAPIAGALVKTGAGTLTLKSSRSEATTLSEGTLVFSGNDTKLDWSKLTLGDDPEKPVTLRFEDGAALASESAECHFGNVAGITSTICKSGGDWKRSGITRIGRADGAKTTFVHEGGTMTFSNYATIGGYVGAQPAKMVVCGGTVDCTREGSAGDVVFNVGPTSDGMLVVTDGATFNVTKRSMLVANNAGKGTLDVSDGGTVNLADGLYFGWAANSTGSGTVNLRTGGTIVADFVKRKNVVGDLTGAFNFQGGTLKAGAAGTLIEAHDKLTVSVDANGGTIDNNRLAITIPCTITGVGGLTLSGAGTTTVSADQFYTGTTTVSNGTTLSVGGGVTFAGPVVFAAGSALDIAEYVGGVTPLSATSLTFPESGNVPLTFNGGAFITGAYAICPTSLVSVAQAEAKFAPSTGGLDCSWDVSATGDLLFLVGDIHGYSWTGLAGDNKFANGGNWVSGIAPSASGSVDFSAVSSNISINMEDVPEGTTFGKVTMGTGVITFTGEFAATSFVSEATHNPTAKIAVAADSTVTIVGDLVFATNSTCYVCYSIAEGGMFAVTGDIIATDKHKSYVIPCQTHSNAGVISAKGLVNNINKSDSDYFALARDSDNALAKWVIGEDGLSGTKRFYVVSSSGATVMITAATNFTISAAVVQKRNLTLDPAGYEITLGTNTSAKSGGILGVGANGLTSVIGTGGTGKVIVNYNVNDLTTAANSRINAFVVSDGATLAFNQGANIGTGLLTVEDRGTLEVAESGTVTHNGDLSLADGAALGFTFTERANPPVLALAEGKAVTFTGEGEIAVKITGDVWPIGGDYVLTACGGFNAEDVSLADGAPKWAKGIGVNEEGNIVLTVRPKSTMIIVR